MMNLTIAGRVGKDAETRSVGGDTVTGFSVACDVYAGKAGKQTVWVRCSMWGKRGETLSRHLTKGASVTVTGAMSVREHDGKTYVELRANDVALQGGKGDARPTAAPRAATNLDDFGGGPSGGDDDLPF